MRSALARAASAEVASPPVSDNNSSSLPAGTTSTFRSAFARVLRRAGVRGFAGDGLAGAVDAGAPGSPAACTRPAPLATWLGPVWVSLVTVCRRPLGAWESWPSRTPRAAFKRTDLLVQLAQPALNRVNDVFDGRHVVIVRIPGGPHCQRPPWGRPLRRPVAERPLLQTAARRVSARRGCASHPHRQRPTHHPQGQSPAVNRDAVPLGPGE